MLHILLVEDNPGDVLMLREAIRTCSVAADVVVAYDGQEALTVMNEYRFEPDIMILDLNLPKLNGFQLLERCRRQEGLPVVVFTSSGSPEDNKRAFELGVKDYVIKPSDLAEYLKTVTDVLGRWIDGAHTRGL
jgi:DNA-binding response OmpR family regulator